LVYGDYDLVYVLSEAVSIVISAKAERMFLI